MENPDQSDSAEELLHILPGNLSLEHPDAQGDVQKVAAVRSLEHPDAQEDAMKVAAVLSLEHVDAQEDGTKLAFVPESPATFDVTLSALLSAVSEHFEGHQCQVESLLRNYLGDMLRLLGGPPAQHDHSPPFSQEDEIRDGGGSLEHHSEEAMGEQQSVALPGTVNSLNHSRGATSHRGITSQSSTEFTDLATDFAPKSTNAKEFLPAFFTKRKSEPDVLSVMKEQARHKRSKTFDTLQSGSLSWYSYQHARLFVSGRSFEALVILLILTNAICIGAQADWSVKHESESEPVVFEVMNAAFTIAFSIELFLRIYAWRKEFFLRIGKDFRWNIFDSALVIAGILDEAMRITSNAPDFFFVRFLRVLRLVRVVRLIRVVRFFHDLRVIVAGIMGAIKSLIWACGLLFMIMFMVSICLLQLMTEYLPELDDRTKLEALTHFGSLTQSIYVLYLSITGGRNWGDIVKSLEDIHVVFVLIFCAYIAFAVLCVLNIITGVFVENAVTLANTDEEQLYIEDLENRMAWYDEVKALFESKVGDKGAMGFKDFKDHMETIDVQTCLHKLGIEAQSISVKSLFQLLDFDNTGFVDVEEFVMGLEMMHGTAKAIDLARVRYEIKGLRKEFRRMAFAGNELRRTKQSLTQSKSDSLSPHRSVSCQRNSDDFDHSTSLEE